MLDLLGFFLTMKVINFQFDFIWLLLPAIRLCFLPLARLQNLQCPLFSPREGISTLSSSHLATSFFNNTNRWTSLSSPPGKAISPVLQSFL